jgi:hypothetical protein
MIFSLDIVSGAEVSYPNCERAAYAAHITPSAMKRSYLDQPRQLKGVSWRTNADHVWTPPPALTYATNVLECAPLGYIRAIWRSAPPVGLGPASVFDNVSAAARITGIDRRAIANAVTNESYIGGAQWSTLRPDEYDNFARNASTMGNVFPVEVLEPPQDKKQGGAAQVIAWNLIYKIEVGFTSLTKAGADTGVSSHAIKNTLLDKPLRSKAWVFRSAAAIRRWEPATFLKYDPSTQEKKMSGYIVTTTEADTDAVAMYEGPSAAARIEGLDRHCISAAVTSGRPYKDFIWRPARDDEVNTFVPV